MRSKLALSLSSVVVIIIGSVALAAGPGAPAQVIPYQGRLELGGTPYNGGAQLGFRVYDDPTAVDPIWSDPGAPGALVPVKDGAFAVLLGNDPSNPFPDTLSRSAELFIEIDVNGQALTGRQQLHAAVMAVRAAEAHDLVVHNTLSVVGQVSGPTTHVGTLTVDGDLEVTGAHRPQLTTTDEAVVEFGSGDSGCNAFNCPSRGGNQEIATLLSLDQALLDPTRSFCALTRVHNQNYSAPDENWPKPLCSVSVTDFGNGPRWALRATYNNDFGSSNWFVSCAARCFLW